MTAITIQSNQGNGDGNTIDNMALEMEMVTDGNRLIPLMVCDMW